MERTMRRPNGRDPSGRHGVRRRPWASLIRLVMLPLACSGLWLSACAGGRPPTQRDLDLALIRAAEAGDVAEVKRLLRAGADIDAEDAEGWTPYLAASSNGQLEAMRILKALGARTHVVEDEGPPLAPPL